MAELLHTRLDLDGRVIHIQGRYRVVELFTYKVGLGWHLAWVAELFTYKIWPGWQSCLHTRWGQGSRVAHIQGLARVASGLGGRIVYIQCRDRVVELFTYKVWPGWHNCLHTRSGQGGRVVYIQGRARGVELFTYKVWPGWHLAWVAELFTYKVGTGW